MRIPDHLIYGDPQACRDVIAGQPLRCDSDSRWRWPDSPAPLPPHETRTISWSLLRRWIGGEVAAVMLAEAGTGGER